MCIMYRVEFLYYDYGFYLSRREIVTYLERCISSYEVARQYELPVKLADTIDDIMVKIYDEDNNVVSSCWATEVKQTFS